MRKILDRKKIGFLFFVSFFITNQCFPGEKERIFTEGNRFYQDGDYRTALENYQKILDMDYESGYVYYNMGNCYYKLQDIGRTVLFYERAYQLMPGDEDLRTNLEIANLSVIDKIIPQPKFFLFRIVDGFVYMLQQPVLTWVVAGFYLISVGLLIGRIVSRNRSFRRVSLHLSVSFGILFLVFGLSLICRLQDTKNRINAIIMLDKVDVMGSPSEDEGIEVFSLHQGTKVRIDQKSGEWVEIVLADGKVGWVKKEVLEII